MEHFDVIILGAGASGLFCGMTAARRGKRVLLMDHAGKPGRKILVSGGGKCNFTNLESGAAHYVGHNAGFRKSALARFSPWDMVSLLSEANIPWEERDLGQLFCLQSAADVTRLLVDRCTGAGCVFHLGQALDAVEHIPAGGETAGTASSETGRYSVHSGEFAASAPKLVVALGSGAWPQIGATDMGHRIARRFGHKVYPARPALVPLVMPPSWPLHGLAGISLDVRITTARTDGPGEASYVRSLLFTHRGISGPAALCASCHWDRGQVIRIDFVPQHDVRSLLDDTANGKLLVRTLISRLLPDRLAQRLTPPQIADRKVAELPRKDREALVGALTAHEVIPTGTEGMRKAEAAAGGVDVNEVSSRTMESTLQPGLYFTGEVLDVTGLLGGYNLHWAWASGKAAGEAI